MIKARLIKERMVPAGHYETELVVECELPIAPKVGNTVEFSNGIRFKVDEIKITPNDPVVEFIENTTRYSDGMD